MRRAIACLLALLAAAPLAAMPARPTRPPVHRAATSPHDWSRTVTVSSAGGFVVGNPQAKVHVVEYGSFTCPHCAHFAKTVTPQLLATWVRPGLATYEFRHALHDRYDLVASLLARCAGPQGFYPASTALFASQQDWIQQAEDYERAHADEIENSPADEKGTVTARAAGLDSFFAARGLPAARQRACLLDQKQLAAVSAMTSEADFKGIPGTPAVFVNDALVPGVAEWPQLDAAIKAAANPTKPR